MSEIPIYGQWLMLGSTCYRLSNFPSSVSVFCVFAIRLWPCAHPFFLNDLPALLSAFNFLCVLIMREKNSGCITFPIKVGCINKPKRLYSSVYIFRKLGLHAPILTNNKKNQSPELPVYAGPSREMPGGNAGFVP